VDPWLIASIHGGDVLWLGMSSMVDLGLSIVRAGRLAVAAGAVHTVSLGEDLRIRSGPDAEPGREEEPQPDGWLEFSIDGETCRLRSGEDATIARYRFSVLRTPEFGFPGESAVLAISLQGACPHEAVLRSALMLAGGGAMEEFSW
jgi:hypothetical protein